MEASPSMTGLSAHVLFCLHRGAGDGGGKTTAGSVDKRPGAARCFGSGPCHAAARASTRTPASRAAERNRCLRVTHIAVSGSLSAFWKISYSLSGARSSCGGARETTSETAWRLWPRMSLSRVHIRRTMQTVNAPQGPPCAGAPRGARAASSSISGLRASSCAVWRDVRRSRSPRSRLLCASAHAQCWSAGD